MCAAAQQPVPAQPGEVEVGSKERRLEEVSKSRVIIQAGGPAGGRTEAEQAEQEPTESREDIGLSRYDPPAALSELANIASETIILVVRSSLEHVTQQVNDEKQQKEAAARIDDDDGSREADSRGDKGKAPVTEEHNAASSIDGERESVVDSQDGSQESVDERHSKFQWRSRFGFRRIFQHIIDKGESSAFDISQIPAHLHGISQPPAATTSTPSSFTQLIYKRLKQASDSSFSVEAIECVSCFDDIKPKESVKTTCHFYCKECFRQLINTALESEAQWPPKCCLNTIPFRTITKHVGPDLLKRYWEKHEEFRVPVENRIYCSEPDCGEWVRKFDKALKTARCSKGHSMCIMCRGVPHPINIACPQDRDRQMADKLAEEEGWRRCFKCSVLVEHKEACQHMTCRCGAQFCYVCGSAWRTCSCTSDQLNAIKQRAAARRQERESKESEEDAWLRNTLRLIEEYERETQRREEAARVAAAARERGRRRQRAIERKQREQARLAALEAKHVELLSTLAKLNDQQRALLSSTQHRETEEGAVYTTAQLDALACKQTEERNSLRSRIATEITERESKWAREYHVRAAWEKRLESEYAGMLQTFWANKDGGQNRADCALRAFMVQNDQRWDAWQRQRDDDLEKYRYAAEDELAVHDEFMTTMRQRQENSLAKLTAERKTKHAAERLWFDLVVAERTRLLAEIYSVERENGGENHESSQLEGSDEAELDVTFLGDTSSV